MTDVLVCVKRVPDVSGEVLLSDDKQSVDATPLLDPGNERLR